MKVSKEKAKLYKEMLKLKLKWQLMPRKNQSQIDALNCVCKRLDTMFLKFQEMR